MRYTDAPHLSLLAELCGSCRPAQEAAHPPPSASGPAGEGGVAWQLLYMCMSLDVTVALSGSQPPCAACFCAQYCVIEPSPQLVVNGATMHAKYDHGFGTLCHFLSSALPRKEATAQRSSSGEVCGATGRLVVGASAQGKSNHTPTASTSGTSLDCGLHDCPDKERTWSR